MRDLAKYFECYDTDRKATGGLFRLRRLTFWFHSLIAWYLPSSFWKRFPPKKSAHLMPPFFWSVRRLNAVDAGQHLKLMQIRWTPPSRKPLPYTLPVSTRRFLHQKISFLRQTVVWYPVCAITHCQWTPKRLSIIICRATGCTLYYKFCNTKLFW